MKTKPVKSAPVPPKNSIDKTRPAAASHPSRSNSALNIQNRRVLAQHYRAKYGVK